MPRRAGTLLITHASLPTSLPTPRTRTTMSTPDILFQSGLRGQLPNTPEEQQAVRFFKELGDQRVLWLQDPDDPHRSAFVAASPAVALQWICQKAAKKDVLAYVRKRASPPLEDAATAATSSPAKRPKHVHKTTSRTKRTNAKAVDDAKAFYRSIWHNSQEAAEDARKEDVFTRERAKWLQYAGKQPEAKGAGTGTVAEAIRRATAVGNAEAIRDLQLSLRHWRATHAVPSTSSQALTSTPWAECQPLVPAETMLGLRDGPSSLRVRYHYLRVESAEQLGAGLGIVRRYHAARLREAYNQRVAREVQPERVPPISRTRKTEVQAELYLNIRPRGVAQRGDRDFDTFLRTLKHGKRWLALEASFGCGIFALLPKTRVPNTFVERTLTDELFSMWVRTLRACSPLVVRMAREITPLVALFADDRVPPPRQTCLEQTHDDLAETEGPTEYLAELLENVGEHDRVQEISSAEEGEGEEEEGEEEEGEEEEGEEGEGEEDVDGCSVDEASGMFVTQAEDDDSVSPGEETLNGTASPPEAEEEYEDIELSDDALHTLL